MIILISHIFDFNLEIISSDDEMRKEKGYLSLIFLHIVCCCCCCCKITVYESRILFSELKKIVYSQSVFIWEEKNPLPAGSKQLHVHTLQDQELTMIRSMLYHSFNLSLAILSHHFCFCLITSPSYCYLKVIIHIFSSFPEAKFFFR